MFSKNLQHFYQTHPSLLFLILQSTCFYDIVLCLWVDLWPWKHFMICRHQNWKLIPILIQRKLPKLGYLIFLHLFFLLIIFSIFWSKWFVDDVWPCGILIISLSCIHCPYHCTTYHQEGSNLMAKRHFNCLPLLTCHVCLSLIRLMLGAFWSMVLLYTIFHKVLRYHKIDSHFLN